MAEPLAPGSEQGFGFTFAIALSLISLIPVLGGEPPLYWLTGLALLFWLAAVLWPRALSELNWLWFRFGMLLHRIVSPVVLTLLYALAIVPIGLLMRAFGKNLLILRKPKAAASYWVERRPPGPAPGSLGNQF
jgi:hypothetical protein